MKKLLLLTLLSSLIFAKALSKDVLFVDVKKSLLENYDINSTENSSSDLYTLAPSAKDIDFTTSVQISLSHRTIDVYTNSHIPATEYIKVCSAVMLALTHEKKSLIEELMVSTFIEATKTTKGLRGNVLGLEVSIVPDSQGFLGCSFYKE